MYRHPLDNSDFMLVQRREYEGTSNGIAFIPNEKARSILELLEDGEMDRLTRVTIEHYKRYIDDEGMRDWLILSMKDYIARLINEKIIIY